MEIKITRFRRLRCGIGGTWFGSEASGDGGDGSDPQPSDGDIVSWDSDETDTKNMADGFNVYSDGGDGYDPCC